MSEMVVCAREGQKLKCLDFEYFMLLLQDQGLIRLQLPAQPAPENQL